MKKIKELLDVVPKRLFVAIVIVAVVMLVASFLLPPLGVVDGSVIAAGWLLFAFAASCVVVHAVNKGADATLTKGDITLSVNNPDAHDKEERE